MPTKISAFTALTGANVDVDADLIPIVDTSAGASGSKSITPEELLLAKSYTQTGNGAVARSPKDKLDDIVSVKDFGATGDGVTDDTAAIVLAVATGKAVFFPEGTYLISSTIEITTSYQRIFGAGDKSIIQAATDTFDMLHPNTGDYITIEKLRFNGGATANTYLKAAIFTDSTVASERTLHLTIKDCLFSGASASYGLTEAIKIAKDCDYAVVEGNRFERLIGGDVSDHGYGIATGETQGSVFRGNIGVASLGRGRHLVYLAAGASYCVVANNIADGFSEAGFTQFSQGAQPSNFANVWVGNTVRNCVSDGNTNAASMQVYGHAEGTVVANNIVAYSGAAGIRVDAAALNDTLRTVIQGNIVLYSAYEGIAVSGGQGTTIDGNIVHESSQNSAGTYSNILLTRNGSDPTDRTTIVGNICTGSSNARSAFQINAVAPLSTNTRLENNRFDTGTVADIELNGATVTGHDKEMTWTPSLKFGGGNTGLTTSTASGKYTQSGKQVTFTGRIVLTAKGSSSGIAEIYGLPVNAADVFSPVDLHIVNVTFADSPEAYVDTNWIQLQEITNAGSRTNLDDTDFANNSEIRVSGTYFVA